MKRTLVIALGFVMAVLSSLAGTPKQEMELTGVGIYYKPGQNDDYDNGFGAEGQVRFWLNPNVGLALSCGVATWQVDDRAAVISYGQAAAGASFKGDVTLIPVGGSILFRPVNDDKIALTLEAGIRYVIIHSQAELEVAAVNANGAAVYAKDTLEIDNGFVGVLGANIEAKIEKNVSILAGIGYQFDLVKGDASWMGTKTGDNELKALMIKAGLSIKR